MREATRAVVAASAVVFGIHVGAIVLGGETTLPNWLVGAQAGAVLAWASKRPTHQ